MNNETPRTKIENHHEYHHAENYQDAKSDSNKVLAGFTKDGLVGETDSHYFFQRETAVRNSN